MENGSETSSASTEESTNESSEEDEEMNFCNLDMRDAVVHLSSSIMAYKDLDVAIATPNGGGLTILIELLGRSKMEIILNRTGFSSGFLLFTYLGVSLFKGKPESPYFRPIANIILSKLSGWKGSNLSMAERVYLCKSIIEGMLTHTISVYVWLVALLKEIEKVARNFI
ncbi:uncharacterized protein LOC131652275 [Vicia villosa]|uniref:uncharacterized protein LOC131652275 n=1 Tax=Vicia villosa TaxID=3911 RepID=UPI00273A77C3|nr:uncharacterized protein LOC131652275 [Vicia villosa]